MYSQRVIERNRLRATKVIKSRNPHLPKHWELAPSSPAQVEEISGHFASLIDEKGRLKRSLTKEEDLWRLCEQTLCKIDFLYFGKNYGKVENEESRISNFVPRIAQKIVLRMMSRMEEQGFALMFLFLKARQLGITLLWQLLIGHRTFFYRNVNTLTGSAVEAKSRKMFGKLEFLYDQLPWWLRPRIEGQRAGEKMEFPDLNSGIYVQWGNQKSGIGRGDTPSVSHLSEIASFEKPEELIDSSLVRAQHENPFSLMGFEGTAEVLGDWLNKTWDYNYRMDADGLARLKPVFLPWFVGRELYPKEAYLRRRPVPDGWVVPEFIENHAKTCENYVRETSYLREELGENWTLPIEQKWFYHLDYDEHRAKDILHLFLREMPATPGQAFQNANPSVFSIETLAEVREQTEGTSPVGVYTLTGPNVPIIYDTGRSYGSGINFIHKDERFYLKGLHLESWPDKSPDNKIFIWEWPQDGEQYGIYCDVAEGAEQDNSVVGVVKRATPWHPDEQVCEWASNRVLQHDLWLWLWALAGIYTTRQQTGAMVYPKIVVEVNLGGGDAVQTELLKRGWSNFHQTHDLTAIGSIGRGVIKRPRGLRPKIGWRTDLKSRPKMISMFRKAVRDGSFLVRSPWLASEMATLEYNLDKQRIEASQGKHDDRVIGPAMLLTSWYDPEIYGNAPTAWLAARERERELEDAPAYVGNTLLGRGSRKYGRTVSGARDSRANYDMG